MFSLFVPMLLSLAVYSQANEDFACGKYSYERNIMEKVVRYEHKLELFEQKMQEWQKVIDANTQQDKETTAAMKILQSEINRQFQEMNMKVAEVAEKTAKRTNIIEADLKDNQNKWVTKITEEMSSLAAVKSSMNQFLRDQEELNAKRDVAFMAQLSTTNENPRKGRLVFDHVLTNRGDAYNFRDGVFTAPVNGSYHFSVVTAVPPKRRSSRSLLHLFVMKGEKQVGYVFSDDNRQYWVRRTTAVTIYLTQGEVVWVKINLVTGDRQLGGCCFHTHWSGFLIYPS